MRRWEEMKKISCHNYFYKILTLFFVLFGVWGIYINLMDPEKKISFIIFSITFTVILLYIFLQICKNIILDENTITYRNILFRKKTIDVSSIEDIIFSQAKAEKYIEIKYKNKIIKIEYSNKKVEIEFKYILQQILTRKHELQNI